MDCPLQSAATRPGLRALARDGEWRASLRCSAKPRSSRLPCARRAVSAFSLPVPEPGKARGAAALTSGLASTLLVYTARPIEVGEIDHGGNKSLVEAQSRPTFRLRLGQLPAARV
jgi:hypothetical protein